MMGGFAFYRSGDDDPPESLFVVSTNPCCTAVVPRYDTFVYIMKHFPHIITDITEEDILDHAASSSLSKALLVVQVTWFCTNCASRLFQSLRLSLLEVSTTARAICALLTYLLWWSKPINVAAPTILRGKEARKVYALLRCSDEEYANALEMAKKRAAGDSSGPHGSGKIALAADALRHLPSPESARPPRSVTFDNSDHMLFPGTLASTTRNGEICGNIIVGISPILYGFPHLLAWDCQFPKPLERHLWRISSILVTCSGFVGISAGCFAVWAYGNERIKFPSMLITLGIVICSIIAPLAYAFGSVFLTYESVRQLFFLDDTVYQVPTWSYYLPHLS